MKRFSFVFTLALITCLTGYAQANWEPGAFQISPFFGYGFGGDFDSKYDRHHDDWFGDGAIELDDDAIWGIRAGVGVARGIGIEFQVSHMPTSFSDGGEDFFDSDTKLADVDLINIHTSLMFDLTRGPVVPYVGFGIGGSLFNVENGSDKTRFSASLAGGLNIRINRNLYFRGEIRGYGILIDSNDCYYYDGYYDYYCNNNDEYLSILEMSVGLSFRI